MDMIVVVEDVKRNLDGLRKVNKICRGDLKVGKQFLKGIVENEIRNLEWRLNIESVKEWCAKKKIEFRYFETSKQFEEWSEVEYNAKHFDSEYCLVNKEIEKYKKEYEELKTKKEEERDALKRELTILDVMGLPW